MSLGGTPRYRLGWRLTRTDDPGTFALSPEDRRRTAVNGDEPEHGIRLSATASR